MTIKRIEVTELTRSDHLMMVRYVCRLWFCFLDGIDNYYGIGHYNGDNENMGQIV